MTVAKSLRKVLVVDDNPVDRDLVAAGIPKALRNRIFDPFFTTKEPGKGTGQGLAIVHRIVVEHHEGTVRVESEPGRGAQFEITLPIALRPAGEEAAA